MGRAHNALLLLQGGGGKACSCVGTVDKLRNPLAYVCGGEHAVAPSMHSVACNNHYHCSSSLQVGLTGVQAGSAEMLTRTLRHLARMSCTLRLLSSAAFSCLTCSGAARGNGALSACVDATLALLSVLC